MRDGIAGVSGEAEQRHVRRGVQSLTACYRLLTLAQLAGDPAYEDLVKELLADPLAFGSIAEVFDFLAVRYGDTPQMTYPEDNEQFFAALKSSKEEIKSWISLHAATTNVPEKLYDSIQKNSKYTAHKAILRKN